MCLQCLRSGLRTEERVPFPSVLSFWWPECRPVGRATMNHKVQTGQQRVKRPEPLLNGISAKVLGHMAELRKEQFTLSVMAY